MSKNIKLLQMAWNCINDSLRTDVSLRYSSETIACAAIFISARKLHVPLPRNPYWFEVLGVEETDIHGWCYRIMALYNRKKRMKHDDLEKHINAFKHKHRRVK